MSGWGDLIEQTFNVVTDFGEIHLNDVPNHSVIDVGVSVYQDVSKIDDSPAMSDFRGEIGSGITQSGDGLTDGDELSFYGGAKHGLGFVVISTAIRRVSG